MADTVIYDDAVIYDALDVTFDGEDTSRTATVTLRGRGRGASSATAAPATTGTVSVRVAGRLAAVSTKASSTSVRIGAAGRGAATGAHAGLTASSLRAPGRVAAAGTRGASAAVILRAPGRLEAAAQRAASAVVVLRAVGSGAVVGTALELQYASPVADLADGSWTNELGSPTDLFASIDESAPSDADYIQSSLSPVVVDEVKLILGALDDPTVDTDHRLSYRYQKSTTGGDQIDLVVRLYAADGSTIIAEQTHTGIDAVTDGTLTLSEAEAAAIPPADYAGLVLGFRAVKV